MGKYVLKRLVYIVVVFFIVSFLMYSLYNLIPTDPARAQLEPMKETLRPDEYDQMYRDLRRELGLDDPLFLRYLKWIGLYPAYGEIIVQAQDVQGNPIQGAKYTIMITDRDAGGKLQERPFRIIETNAAGIATQKTSHGTYKVLQTYVPDGYTPDTEPLMIKTEGSLQGMLQGYFGYSAYFKNDVVNAIREPIKNTMFINIFATIAALGITIPLGIYIAVHKGKKVDSVVQTVTILGYSIPIYIISLIFMYFFVVRWRIFPLIGSKTPGMVYANAWEEFLDRLKHIALPVIVMTFASLGGMTRYVRSSMIEALGTDYIRTARAKGVHEKVVIYSHAWRNALLPIITSILGWFLSIFSGSVIIENTFSLNGMGRLYWLGLNNRDFELVLAIQMFYTIVSLLGVLLIDLSYGIVDPRVRVDK
ncbi:MAG: ABC transporter permease [Fastidiosipila sp.]|nr:ABC transporter permease [Fastidiosipila sp.]